jgi:hypothetical protein
VGSCAPSADREDVTVALTIIDINGRFEAHGTAALVCDACQEPLLGPGAGTVMWFRRYPQPGAHPELTSMHAAHRGRCELELTDRLHEELGPGWIDQSVDATVFARQLLTTLEDEFVPLPEFDYVAPQPSSWRLERAASERPEAPGDV